MSENNSELPLVRSDPSVQKCESKLCCKATAALNTEVEKELAAEDKPLKEILDADEDTNTTGE